jgi:hypothetical protein
MSDEKLGVELLEKVIDCVVKDIVLGKKIAEGGVNGADVVHIPALIEAVKDIIELASHSKEAIEQAKDIDASEVGVLLMKAWSGYQEAAKA